MPVETSLGHAELSGQALDAHVLDAFAHEDLDAGIDPGCGLEPQAARAAMTAILDHRPCHHPSGLAAHLVACAACTGHTLACLPIRPPAPIAGACGGGTYHDRQVAGTCPCTGRPGILMR